MRWLFRFFRFFGAVSRRNTVRKNLRDTLFVETERAKGQATAADYWLKRDLREARSAKDKS